jgi:hypothetical protein
MKRRFFGFLLVFIFVAFMSKAQLYLEKGEEYSPWERTFFGGNFGLSFGNIVTSVSVDPLIGYMITPSLSAGVQGSYTYIEWRRFNTRDNILGYRFFVRQNINTPILNNQFFIQGEFEQLNVEFPDFGPNNTIINRRDWVQGTFIGPGIFLPNRNRGGFHIMLLYNFQHDRVRSPYASEIVMRTGFIF